MSINGMNFFAGNNSSGKLNQKNNYEESVHDDVAEEQNINISSSENTSSLKDLDFSLVCDTIRCKNLQRQLDTRLKNLKFSVNQ